MKRIIFILTLFVLFINYCIAAPSCVKKEMQVITSDGFNINAQFVYPKIKAQKEYSTVVLLHSLGYSSEWWGDLPDKLLKEGYAVLKVDLRGHGKSVYNSKLSRNSWQNMTNSAFAKYPDDVIQVIEKVKTENSKKIFFENWAIIGSDIGASTGIIVADKVSYKPKTIVMLSPVIKTKGIYIPIKLAQLDNIDILSISGTNDTLAENAQNYLQKFAQAQFLTYASSAYKTGMLMLKSDTTLSTIIIKWIKEYI